MSRIESDTFLMNHIFALSQLFSKEGIKAVKFL